MCYILCCSVLQGAALSRCNARCNTHICNTHIISRIYAICVLSCVAVCCRAHHYNTYAEVVTLLQHPATPWNTLQHTRAMTKHTPSCVYVCICVCLCVCVCECAWLTIYHQLRTGSGLIMCLQHTVMQAHTHTHTHTHIDTQICINIHVISPDITCICMHIFWNASTHTHTRTHS